MLRTVFGLHRARLLGPAGVAARLQQASPLATEIQWRDLIQVHGEQFRRQIGPHRLVTLNRSGREVFLRVLLHELFEKHRQGRWHRCGDAPGAGLAHLFLGAARRLGGHRLLLRCEPGFPEKLLLFAGGSQGEFVAPDHLPRCVLAFVDRHNVTTPYARFSNEVQSASRRSAPSFRRRAG
jgi:hypothetical protein